MSTRPGRGGATSAGGDERRPAETRGGLAGSIARGEVADLHAEAHAVRRVVLDHASVMAPRRERRTQRVGRRTLTIGGHLDGEAVGGCRSGRGEASLGRGWPVRGGGGCVARGRRV